MLSNSEIYLRAPEPEDLSILFKWENDVDLWQYGSTISPFSKYTLKQYIANGNGDIFQTKQLRFIVVLKETDKAIGAVDIFDFDAFNNKAAIGILIDKDYQNKGLGYSALRLLIRYSFSFLNINMLYCFVDTQNQSSNRLFQKNGFKSNLILNQWFRINQTFKDVNFYQLLNSDTVLEES